MAKKANTRSDSTSREEIKAQDEALKDERRADRSETQRDLVEAQPEPSPKSAEKLEVVREAQQDLREASLETQERAHAISSLGGEEERGQRPELPISDANPPSDQSIHELTTTDLHPSVTTPQGTQADSIGDAHELRDVNFRALAGWFIGLFVGIGVSIALMVLMFNILLASQKYKDEWPSPLLAEVEPEPPGRPLLANPELPLQEYNQEKEVFLSEYSRDPQTGQVRIPIERAIDLMAQQGLPSTLPSPSGARTRVLPGQAEAEGIPQVRTRPVDRILPSKLGVGKNDPGFAFRVPRDGDNSPAGQHRDLDGVGGIPQGDQGH